MGTDSLLLARAMHRIVREAVGEPAAHSVIALAHPRAIPLASDDVHDRNMHDEMAMLKIGDRVMFHWRDGILEGKGVLDDFVGLSCPVNQHADCVFEVKKHPQRCSAALRLISICSRVPDRRSLSGCGSARF